MPNMRVVWRPEAIDDIRAIIAYIDVHDPAAASATGAKLFDLGDSLVHFPNRGRRLDDRVREMTNVPPFILRYSVAGDIVSILSVHHGARNLK